MPVSSSAPTLSSGGTASLLPSTTTASSSFPAALFRQHSTDGDDISSQSHPCSTTDSQDTAMTASTDPACTPPASESGAGPSSQDSQLLQLSQVAAAQDKMATATADAWGSRKRMADGEVKARSQSTSPVKRHHSRNASSVSRASVTGSYLGELSAELRTRLSYAMVKVNHGWQSNSLDEVETLASHAASPTSSTSTVHRRHGSSASPRLAISSAPTASAPSLYEPVAQLRRSNSPPRTSSGKPALAPPASIQPSINMPAPRSNPRRNSNPHYTPTLLSHSHSASPHTPAQLTVQTGSRPRNNVDPVLFSPHQNVREQDAIESLLFMSSPGNSANLKHAFSPTGSPGPHAGAGRTLPSRHALPAGPRKALPSSQRQPYQSKRLGFERSPGMPPPPGSPMDLDSPQQPSHTPNRGTPRRRMNGGSSHLRGALSLPSGLGIGNGVARKILRDEDIERMLDRAGAEQADSSDDEEIQIPQPRSGVASVMQV
ncbi:hypothetical protein EDB81DRAFT_635777 [Dactylonectria macrodidyma]|uniref:Cyclin-dependent kinase n=1 Tax=Dactylonectria macrodidyma TaxID=307937 RepID=A0A9P9JHH8_9HYPO|nr:hypothetical protein EDB81DRAFT_635777 [Dactylonectria macrodidyma]